MTIQNSNNGSKENAEENAEENIEGGLIEEEVINKQQTPRAFPSSFYCPITKEILIAPVVIADGNSYERTAVEKRGDIPSEKMYPNRALEAVMEEIIETSGQSMTATLKRFGHSMRKNMNIVIEKSAIPSKEVRPLPEAYYCPITFNLIHDPAIDPEGNTYERTAIEYWIRSNGNSPVTRTSAKVEDLYPNNALAIAMEEEANRGDDLIHSPFRGWKDEPAPEVPESDDPESGTVSFPSNPEELEAAEQGRTRSNANALGILLVILVFCASAIICAPDYFLEEENCCE